MKDSNRVKKAIEKNKVIFKKISPFNKSKKQVRKQIIIEAIVLLPIAVLTVVFLYFDYNERPGILHHSDIKAVECGVNNISLEWEEARNTDKYILYYKPKGEEYKEWKKMILEGSSEEDIQEGEIYKKQAKIEGLEEGKTYCFVVRADNEERKGFNTEVVYYSTRNDQKIEAKDSITALTVSKDLKLEASAKTKMSFKSSDNKIAKVNEKNGKIDIKKAGQVDIIIKAKESEKYVGAKKKISLNVLPAKPVESSRAGVNIIHSLDSSNCEALFSVHMGPTPQSLAYTGDKYMVAYDNRGIRQYSKEGDLVKTSYSSSIGKANGMTYCDTTKLCYSMRGSSSRVDIYNPKNGEFSSISVFCGASGIGYDRIDDVIYMSSRTGIRVFSADGKFEHKKMISNVSRGGKIYTQDCCGHGGVVIRCISGPNKHGTNYLDLYNIKKGTYLGTIEVNLGEVESAIVDNDGYLQLLVNSRDDYIWKTDINIDDIAKSIN